LCRVELSTVGGRRQFLHVACDDCFFLGKHGIRQGIMITTVGRDGRIQYKSCLVVIMYHSTKQSILVGRIGAFQNEIGIVEFADSTKKCIYKRRMCIVTAYILSYTIALASFG
jgi:hypothetical protein